MAKCEVMESNMRLIWENGGKKECTESTQCLRILEITCSRNNYHLITAFADQGHKHVIILHIVPESASMYDSTMWLQRKLHNSTLLKLNTIMSACTTFWELLNKSVEPSSSGHIKFKGVVAWLKKKVWWEHFPKLHILTLSIGHSWMHNT